MSAQVLQYHVQKVMLIMAMVHVYAIQRMDTYVVMLVDMYTMILAKIVIAVRHVLLAIIAKAEHGI